MISLLMTLLVMKDRDYPLNPAANFNENKSAMECFVLPNVEKDLCNWTNEKVRMHFTEKGCYTMKLYKLS